MLLNCSVSHLGVLCIVHCALWARNCIYSNSGFFFDLSFWWRLIVKLLLRGVLIDHLVVLDTVELGWLFFKSLGESCWRCVTPIRIRDWSWSWYSAESSWLPGCAWCCGVWLSSLQVLGSHIVVMPLSFQYAADVVAALVNPNCWCCQILCLLVYHARLLLLDDWWDGGFEGRFSYATIPVWCCGSFRHCKRSSTWSWVSDNTLEVTRLD